MLNMIATEQNQVSVTFHIARDTEFRQGVTDGRHLLLPAWDLAGCEGWWNLEALLQFVQHELSPQRQATENQIRHWRELPPHTPIYHLGLVAGYLSRFAEAATAGREVQAC